MIRWVRRTAALFTGAACSVLLLSRGAVAPAGASMLLGLLWGASDLLPAVIFQGLNAAALPAFTAFLVFLALDGFPAGWLVGLSGATLLAWNAGLRLARRPRAPLPDQLRYLRQVALPVALGVVLGLTALALSGKLAPGFPLVWLLTIIACLLLFYLLRAAARRR
jgi:hypothetical protein